MALVCGTARMHRPPSCEWIESRGSQFRADSSQLCRTLERSSVLARPAAGQQRNRIHCSTTTRSRLAARQFRPARRVSIPGLIQGLRPALTPFRIDRVATMRTNPEVGF